MGITTRLKPECTSRICKRPQTKVTSDKNQPTIDSSITHIRPRFRFEVSQPQDEILNRIKGLLDQSPDHVTGEIVDDHVILDIQGEEVHYWSPQLNFRIEVDEENPNHSIVRGLIGPRPPVWTLFMFIYFSIGAAGFFTSAWAVSRYMLDHYTPWVWAFPVAILFMLTAYRIGKYGESLARDQTEILKQFVRDSVQIK